MSDTITEPYIYCSRVFPSISACVVYDSLTPDLHTDYAGIELRNPLIVSPAGISETVRRMKKAEKAGCGAVVVKTLFQDEITRRSPTPRFKVMRSRSGSEDSFVLYSYEQASSFGPNRYAQEIGRAKRELGIPVIASIGCAEDESWLDYSRLVEEAGADGVELNMSCPHGRSLLAGSDLADAMYDATRLVKDAVSIPVIPKMTPQTTSPLQVALGLEKAGADAVVMFNRFTGLDIDLETGAPVMHGGFAGHGGPWSIHYLLRWLVSTCPRLSIPISASGGIWSGLDMAKAILAGATTTQMCTAVVVEGYVKIAQALGELEAFMERKGHSTLADFRGRTPGLVLSTDQIDRRRRVSALVDPSRCTSCGLCERVCIYEAVGREEGEFTIMTSCQGCGLCVELCPADAISLRPI